MIRPIKPLDIGEVYKIWKAGTDVIMRDKMSLVESNTDCYERLIAQNVFGQTENFKLWGAFEKDELVGWTSVLPCHPTPLVHNHYAELSLYIRPDFFRSGIGSDLTKHAIKEARKNSSLYYITALIPPNHEAVTKIAEDNGFQKIGMIPRSSKDKSLPDCDYWILPL